MFTPFVEELMGIMVLFSHISKIGGRKEEGGNFTMSLDGMAKRSKNCGTLRPYCLGSKLNLSIFYHENQATSTFLKEDTLSRHGFRP